MSWNPVIGGLVLSVLVILLEFYGIPLNIVESFYNSSLILIVLGLIGGAFISSCFSNNFGFKIPTKIEVFKAIFAGILMGMGSALAFGDNIGGFYTATANLSASGLTMFGGLIVGTLIGIRYLIWESEKIPSKGGINVYIKKFGFFMGLAVIFIILWGSLKQFLLIFSALAGFFFHRSKLCMAKALREPFVSGESFMTRGFAVSLLIAVVGISYLKFAKIQDPGFYVLPAFMLGSFIGGILFGLGMILADSCALSMLWKLGEGQLKMLIVLVFFILGNFVSKSYLNNILMLWGKNYFWKKVFLAEYLTYSGAILTIVAIILLWLIFSEWARKTKKFVIKI